MGSGWPSRSRRMDVDGVDQPRAAPPAGVQRPPLPPAAGPAITQDGEKGQRSHWVTLRGHLGPGKARPAACLAGMAQLGGVGEGSGRGQKAATCEAPGIPPDREGWAWAALAGACPTASRLSRRAGYEARLFCILTDAGYPSGRARPACPRRAGGCIWDQPCPLLWGLTGRGLPRQAQEGGVLDQAAQEEQGWTSPLGF